MEYLTLRKDLRNIDLKSLYFGGHYIIRFFHFIKFYLAFFKAPNNRPETIAPIKMNKR